MQASILYELFTYDGTCLRHKKIRHGVNKNMVGSPAGFIDAKGYRIIKVRGKAYKEHRLIWMYVHGNWPSGEIDHINRDKLDNRISNLRDCDRYTNMRNLGDVGVSICRNKYKARLGQKHLGHFDTYEQALAARKLAEQVHWA